MFILAHIFFKVELAFKFGFQSLVFLTSVLNLVNN